MVTDFGASMSSPGFARVSQRQQWQNPDLFCGAGSLSPGFARQQWQNPDLAGDLRNPDLLSPGPANVGEISPGSAGHSFRERGMRYHAKSYSTLSTQRVETREFGESPLGTREFVACFGEY